MPARLTSGQQPSPQLDELVDFVLDQVGRPEDSRAVAATLESRGVRDVDALTRHGEPDVFALADRVYDECLRRLAGDMEPPSTAVAPLRERFGRVLRLYGRGAFSGLPMLVQTACMVLLGYTLWGYLGFEPAMATCVALASLLSLVVTGGFTQSIGRLVTFYVQQLSWEFARQSGWRLVRYGIAGSVSAGGLLMLADRWSGWIPPGLMATAAAYYLLLCLLWLLLALLYALEMRAAIASSFVLGLAVVFSVHSLTSVPVQGAHWAGLSVTNAIAAGWSWLALRRRSAVSREGSGQRLPRRALHAYGVAPYFGYGVLYFCFLFADRLLAWSAGRHPLPVWFDSRYEMGLDLALLVMVLMVAHLEYSVHEFSDSLVRTQQRYPAVELSAHNRHHLSFYRRQVRVLLRLGVLAGTAVTGSLLLLEPDGMTGNAGAVTWPVFALGTVGYVLLVLGLLNAALLFSLSRTGPVLTGLAAGLAVDLLVAWPLSRLVAYWCSVVGLVAGAAVFTAVTTVGTIRVLRRLDYFYYSAY